MSELVELCDVSYVEEGKLKPIDVEGLQLMITKLDDRYLLTSRTCTHKTYDLTQGHYADGFVTCLLHTSVFDMETGEPMNPPAHKDLEVYDAIEKDGKLYIEG